MLLPMRTQFSPVWILLISVISIFPTISRAAAVFGRADVVAIQNGRTADLIVLDSGFKSGLRQGMICGVSRGSLSLGTVLLVELRPTASAALILSLNSGQMLAAGDQIVIKIINT